MRSGRSGFEILDANEFCGSERAHWQRGFLWVDIVSKKLQEMAGTEKRR